MIEIIHCKDCGKKLSAFAYYLKYKRCIPCASKIRGKYQTNNSLKKIYKCLLCGHKFRTYKSSNRKYCKLEHSYIHRSLLGYIKTKKIMMKLSKNFICWLTGFWEGEGCISNRPGYRNFNCSIAQNEYYVIHKIKQQIPIGHIYRHLSCKTIMYHFVLNGIGASVAFIETILPYVKSLKRKKQIKRLFQESRIYNFKKYIGGIC